MIFELLRVQYLRLWVPLFHSLLTVGVSVCLSVCLSVDAKEAGEKCAPRGNCQSDPGPVGLTSLHPKGEVVHLTC